MTLYFENSKGERRVIAKPKTKEAAMREIAKFFDDRNFKIYYIRSWQTPDGFIVFDVGSHTEFFYLRQ